MDLEETIDKLRAILEASGDDPRRELIVLLTPGEIRQLVEHCSPGAHQRLVSARSFIGKIKTK